MLRNLKLMLMNKFKFKQTTHIVALLLGVLILAFSGKAQTIRITDIKPNSFEDAVPAVKKAIAACKARGATVLEFPEGRYDFWPEHAEKKEYFISNTSSETECPSKVKTIGVLVEGIKNLTIEGNGSLFVFHGKMLPFVFDGCDNIRMQNVSMDFERPTMSEMTFKEISEDHITVQIHPDSRYTIINDKLVWYGEGWGMNNFHAILVTQDGREFYSSWNPFSKAKAESLGLFEVRFTGDFKKSNYKVGQTLTVRDPIRDQVGGFINRSANIELNQVSMHYMHGLGIVSQFSENVTFTKVNVMPRPGSDREIATFADCMHFSGCKGQILIEDCRFSGAHDDPVNVHGTHLQVTEILGPKRIRVRFMHHQTYGMEAFFAGDSIAFVHSPSLNIYASGQITSAELISDREMELDLKENLPKMLQKGDCLENLTYTPSLTIRNCRFERTNTRGVLVTTRRRVVIENNTFVKTGMHAILIANDASGWFESGPVNDVTIRGNIFEDCAYNSAPDNYVIAILPEDHQKIRTQSIHHNINIEKNIFKIYDTPVLKARSTSNLNFSDNEIQYTIKDEYPRNSRPMFNFDNCKMVRMEGNTFNILPTIQLIDMNKKELSKSPHLWLSRGRK